MVLNTSLSSFQSIRAAKPLEQNLLSVDLIETYVLLPL